ncbi:MAG: type II toxin-antitoxin system HicB family antitoxin [Drouetiella hepatica Uher 2000/2452]|jgi:predicted RNase H-like HicB family nuclease|uniref:Type II toxin-antitoxin system HicB family antitoxin n=1 Tax=Drouetiella hepatica Uher 2000/2452 TaxID=904376 RepID=A0A951Q7G3_9CYAN|nr:type II toxin-antitoxin system HicB family antitoxin [Drouetiella hepatica Uher 2000/2452]
MTVVEPQINSKRKVLLYPGEDGYFVVEVPSLPGCISQGRTRDEALENIEEAITLYVEVLQNRGESVPDDQVEVVLV